MFLGQGFKLSVGLAVVLDEYQVPDLHHLWVVAVDQLVAGGLLPFGLAADIDVDLRTGAAGSLVAHLPEIVLFGAHQNAGFGKDGLPDLVGLLVALEGIGIVAAFENGHIEAVFVNTAHPSQKIPGPPNGFLLEIIAEAPVAEHFEEGVVVGIAPHLFQVVVLAADPQALLGIGHAPELRAAHPQEILLELVHPGIGEQQGRVILHHQGCRGDDFVFPLLKKR